MRMRLLIVGLWLAGMVAGCGGSSAPSRDTSAESAVDVAATATYHAQEASSKQQAATQSGLSAATSTAQAQRAEQQAATRQAGTAQAQEAERQAATRQAATAQIELAMTAAADEMRGLIEQLQADGYLESTDGTYIALEDFDQSWAQINWYQWWYTGYSPTDFVIVADAEWDSASDRANWWTSGCGFVFRENGVPNHYLAYLGLDGYVYFARNVNGVFAQLGRSYYGRVGTPSGQAQLMLVVEGASISFFVNGERVHSRNDQGLASGELALTLLSGINTGFGTRCRMTNIELWELD